MHDAANGKSKRSNIVFQVSATRVPQQMCVTASINISKTIYSSERIVHDLDKLCHNWSWLMHAPPCEISSTPPISKMLSLFASFVCSLVFQFLLFPIWFCGECCAPINFRSKVKTKWRVNLLDVANYSLPPARTDSIGKFFFVHVDRKASSDPSLRKAIYIYIYCRFCLPQHDLLLAWLAIGSVHRSLKAY